MHIITVASRKGGTGKTTTAGAVAQGLANAGNRVALIDLDSQANAASMFLRRVPKEFRVEQWLLGAEPKWSKAEPPKRASFDLLHGVAGDFAMDPEAFKARLLSLDFDFVVFDCPPSESVMVRAAVDNAHTVLATMEPSSWALSGAMAVANGVRRDQRLAFVVTRYGGPQRQLEDACLETLKAFPHEVFTVATSSSVPKIAGSHHGFPQKGKPSLDLHELVEWLGEVA